ncbi:hypothetical protein [Clostridium saccharobutylicum]|uniref:6-phospho-beta-glucosidase n=1 Tax=Clostridium saccharobutylicum TaxID=169679 RepID=A0A1S8NHL3_CLOSA|nr:hypothetical protein [Clostridium saccharobutylicum]OOM15947.1 6-phospho-beta-glucosidase [Clostridium saccharobutylicum]
MILNKLSSRYPNLPLMVVENVFGAVDKVEEDESIDDDGTGDFLGSKKDSFYWHKKCIESNGKIT